MSFIHDKTKNMESLIQDDTYRLVGNLESIRVSASSSKTRSMVSSLPSQLDSSVCECLKKRIIVIRNSRSQICSFEVSMSSMTRDLPFSRNKSCVPLTFVIIRLITRSFSCGLSASILSNRETITVSVACANGRDLSRRNSLHSFS